MEIGKCKECGKQNWTITKETRVKSYSAITPSGEMKWVEVKREEKTPIVECAVCGCKESEHHDIQIKKKGKGYNVIFQTRFWNKFQ